jgi:hypothetical protein
MFDAHNNDRNIVQTPNVENKQKNSEDNVEKIQPIYTSAQCARTLAISL